MGKIENVPFYHGDLVHWLTDGTGGIMEMLGRQPIAQLEVMSIGEIEHAMYQHQVPSQYTAKIYYGRVSDQDCYFLPNEPFEDNLQIVGTYKSNRYILVSESHQKVYTITANDMMDILLKGRIEKGMIFGTWKFAKRSNWGIVAVI